MPDTSVRISVRFSFPNSKIEKILKEKDEWIRQQQQLLQTRTIERRSSTTDEYFYLGIAYPLAVGNNPKAIVELTDKFYIGTTNKNSAKIYLTSWYKQQARKIITERVHHYARLSSLSFNSIT